MSSTGVVDGGIRMRIAVVAAVLTAMSMGAPASHGQVTSNFGMRGDPFHGGRRMHAGMDMGGKVGTPIYATGDGYVRRSRWAGGYGNLVEIEHGFGYQTRFGHLSRSLVLEGQFVRRGQMIALMGSTGRSTGPHLHYEVRIGGRPVDPIRYMQIVFNQLPDWNAVRYAALQKTPAPTAVQSRGVATVALVSARRARPSEDLRTVGDLEIDYGGRGSSNAARPAQAGFGGGHVRFNK